MATESEIKAVNKFNKEKTKVIPVRLNFKTDADILSHLETVSSKMGYIKKLIRDDMVKNRKQG
jgi:hypothetical protein